MYPAKGDEVAELARASQGVSYPRYVFLLGGPLAAAALYFIAGEPLWALAFLGALSVAGFIMPTWRQTAAFSRVIFVYLALTFLINVAGIAYPYSNIFVLTGLLGMFALSGMSWQALNFAPGATGQGRKIAVLCALGLTALILAIYFWQPALLGENPTPKNWPADVIVMMAIGYAIFSALMEETIFRGLFMAHAREHLNLNLAIVVQALLFAIMHYRVGFPMNAAGAALALLWGLAAGWLVKKSESIHPAYLMHFIIVLALFLVLAFI